MLIQFFVKPFSQPTICVSLDDNITYQEFKCFIAHKFNIPEDKFRTMIGNNFPEIKYSEDSTLSTIGIKNDTSVYLIEKIYPSLIVKI